MAAALSRTSLLPWILLCCGFWPSRSEDCDEVTGTSVRLSMEAAQSECVQESIDDFNNFVVTTIVICFLIGVLTSLALVGCLLGPLLKRRGSSASCSSCPSCSCLTGNCKDSAVGNVICSSILAALCVALPLFLRAIAWIPFFDSLCGCRGCLSAAEMACWMENADITDQDHADLMVLPIFAGVLTFVFSMMLLVVNLLEWARNKT